MNRTGYTEQRAGPHTAFAQAVFERFRQKSFRPEWCAVVGDGPDMRIVDRDGTVAYVDTKTRSAGKRNYAVKIGSLQEYHRLLLQGHRVYIVWDNGSIDILETLIARIRGGPRRRSGDGSYTDWVLVEEGGTPFDTFFSTGGQNDLGLERSGC